LLRRLAVGPVRRSRAHRHHTCADAAGPPGCTAAQRRTGDLSVRNLMRKRGAEKEKAPTRRSGLKSLNAVITVRHLLREEKQGMTALRLSFTNYFSRCAALPGRLRHRNNAKFRPVSRTVRRLSVHHIGATSRAPPATLSDQPTEAFAPR
jgi:hypothetical protein